MILNGSIYNEKKLRNIVQNNREINKININDIITIKFCNASRKLMIKCLKKKKKLLTPHLNIQVLLKKNPIGIQILVLK